MVLSTLCRRLIIHNYVQVFHVFHTSCLIDWIAFCEAKAWKASHSENRNKKVRRSRQTVVDQSLDPSGRQDVAGTKTGIGEDGVIFCPECQGTGVKVHSAQLERPRFRLAQVKYLNKHLDCG